ncbi:MAG: TetR/AcrR family transcriptional regulator [bacterium]
MTPYSPQPDNRNDARSSATRKRLIAGTTEALVELGYTKTTGVEVCRRAEVTRGALNHHYPDFADLLVDTLDQLYHQLLDLKHDGSTGLLEQITQEGHLRVTQREFKAVIELWLASKNDEAIGARLAEAIAHGAALFSPEMVLSRKRERTRAKEFEAVYRTITEALIGIGLGRAINGGEAMAHEAMVLQTLLKLAREYDQQHKLYNRI